MRAFEIHLNGERVCVAGIGDSGVLTAIVTWVARKHHAELTFEVGGLADPTDEHVSWIHQKSLRVGDEVRVKVVEAGSVDKPTKRLRIDPAQRLRSEKRYVREMARQFGWKIQAQRKKSNS